MIRLPVSTGGLVGEAFVSPAGVLGGTIVQLAPGRCSMTPANSSGALCVAMDAVDLVTACELAVENRNRGAL